MRSKLLLGGAAATAALGVRVARSLQARRRRVPPAAEPEDVGGLREDLRRELERLAGADVKASGSRREPASPPG